jgi:hypothetical protein
MTVSVTVDAAGALVGGGARFRVELYQYLARTKREDVRLIGAGRRLGPAWLLRRELGKPNRGRRVALNNVSFVTPGGERWTRLGNPLDFLTDSEWADLDPSLRSATRRRAPVVRWAAHRSDVIVTPSAAMAERVARVVPSLRSRIFPRLNPVSADSIPSMPRDQVILCPVLFSPYKHMAARITEWIDAIDDYIDPAVRMLVTANRDEVPANLAGHPRIELVGQLPHAQLRHLWARSRVIYFPTAIESFGFPLAEARVNGQPVIARDTEQNREIAGPALCGFTVGDADSLRKATEHALTTEVAADPAPFEPDAYFSWLLGPPR